MMAATNGTTLEQLAALYGLISMQMLVPVIIVSMNTMVVLDSVLTTVLHRLVLMHLQMIQCIIILMVLIIILH